MTLSTTRAETIKKVNIQNKGRKNYVFYLKTDRAIYLRICQTRIEDLAELMEISVKHGKIDFQTRESRVQTAGEV